MNGLWALATLEVLTIVRDRTMQAMFLLTAVSALLFLPGMRYFVFDDGDDEKETPTEQIAQPKPQPTEKCGDGDWPAMYAENAELLPDDLVWPGAFVDEEAANLRMVVSMDDDIPILRLIEIDDVELSAAEKCVRAIVETTRKARYDALGLPVYPLVLVQAKVLNDEGADDTAGDDEADSPALSLLGSLLGVIAVMISGSLAIEAVPRRRASGLFEQLRCTQTRESELVWAWILSLVALTTVLCVACAAAFMATAYYYELLEHLEHGLHAPAIAAVVGAASIRTSLHASDVQSATLRWFAVLGVMTVAVGLSVYLIETPWLAALVPIGGSLVASSGYLGAAGFLSDFAAIGWTALIVAWCAHSLANEEAASAGVDPALQRRAHGNYLPEALFLTCLGMACAVLAGGAAFGGNLWVGMTFGFVGFMLLPSLMAGPVLGINWRELLPLHKPAVRDVAFAIPMTVGMLGLSTFVMGASAAVIPDNAIIRGFIETMNEATQGTWAAVAIGIYPAICEEFLYRGVILGLLMRSGNTRLAIVLQAAAFSVAHLVSLRLPWTFVFGLVMGWIRVRTGSLWACMALHFTFNFTAASLPLIITIETTTIGWTEAAWSLPLLIGLAVLPFYTRGITVADAPEGVPRR